MPKLYIAFHDNGVVRDIAPEALEGYLPLPGKNPSPLALRYGLQDGQVVDRYAGRTDEEVLADLKALQDEEAQRQQATTPRIIRKLDFWERFTREERVSLRAAIPASPVAADFLALLDLSETVNLRDADLMASLSNLEAARLLEPGRAATLLA